MVQNSSCISKLCNIIYKSIEILGFEKKFSCFLLTDALTSCIFLLTSSYTSDEKKSTQGVLPQRASVWCKEAQETLPKMVLELIG